MGNEYIAMTAAFMVVLVLAAAALAQWIEDRLLAAFGDGAKSAEGAQQEEINNLRAANIRLALHIEELEGWAGAAKHVHGWAVLMERTERAVPSDPAFEQAAQIKSSIERFLDEDQLTGL